MTDADTRRTPTNSGEPVSTTIRRLGPAGPLALIAAICPALGGFLLLGFTPAIGEWLRGHAGVGVAIYIVAFALLSGFALLPTYAQAILGGWAFGFAIGFPAALAGILGGAIIGYIVARGAAGPRVMNLIREKPTWLAVREALIGGGAAKSLWIVFLLRLPPNSPFALTNLVMGSTHVGFGVYVVGTVLGLAPRTAAAVFIAQSVKDLTHPETPKWMVITGIALAVVAILIVGNIATKAISRISSKGTPHNLGPDAS